MGNKINELPLPFAQFDEIDFKCEVTCSSKNKLHIFNGNICETIVKVIMESNY